MAEPKRYMVRIGIFGADAYEDEEGNLVSHSDWECLAAENKRLEEALAGAERHMVKQDAETRRLRDRLINVRNRIIYLLADVERCGDFENLTEKELPNIHDRIVSTLEARGDG